MGPSDFCCLRLVTWRDGNIALPTIHDGAGSTIRMQSAMQENLRHNKFPYEVLDTLKIPWLCNSVVVGSIGELLPYLGSFADLE